MARFMFLTWNGGGNVPPEVGLAQHLRNRGHEVIFAGYAAQEVHFRALGFPFVLLERSQSAFEAAVPEGGPAPLLKGVILPPEQLTEVPEVFARERADALVVDCMMFAAVTAAECNHIPAAVLVHSPPGALLNPDRLLGMFVPKPLDAMREAAGLTPVSHLWDAWSGMPAICTSIPQLDPVRDEVPSFVQYIGPIAEETPASGWRSPWAENDERPLVLVSFSTYQAFPQRSRIERTLAGLADRPYRVLVTSTTADVSGIAIPENAALVEHVPHSEVLPGVAATVSHGGHGTIISSLAHGVPLVCLPNPPVADQTILSHQVEALGAGHALDGEGAASEEIARAVDEIISVSTYRSAADELGRIIKESPGAAAAVSMLEGLIEV